MFKTIAAVSIILFMPIIGEKKKATRDEPPKILSQTPLTEKQCEGRKNDPLGCNGANVVIENLNLKQVTATLNCGPSSEEVDVTIPARTRLYVEIELDFPGTCAVKTWK